MKMQTVQFPWKIPHNASVQVIGIEPITLHDDYDNNQLWLPFIHAMIIHTGSKVEETQQQKNIASTIRQRASRTYVTIPNVDRVLFLPERGVAQLPLPFPGWRRIGKGIWKRFYAAARYPGWDLSHDGKPLTFAFDPLQQAEVEEYMDDNCRGRYSFKKGRVYIELKTDYVVAKIAYSIGD